MLVCAGIAELSSKQLHAHDGTEGYEEGNEHSYVHQGDQRHQDRVHHNLQRWNTYSSYKKPEIYIILKSGIQTLDLHF